MSYQEPQSKDKPMDYYELADFLGKPRSTVHGWCVRFGAENVRKCVPLPSDVISRCIDYAADLEDYGKMMQPIATPHRDTLPKSSQELIRNVCNSLADFLCKKNEAYGNSALNPCRIFAKDVDADAQLNVRIDDKLNRLMRGNAYAGDNDVLDLAGYLVLKLVKAGWGTEQ